jgi:hypothetical protein
VWNLILVCLEIVLVSMQARSIVCAKRTTGSEKSFWTHTMAMLRDVGHVESYFIPFGDTDNLDAR